MSKRAEQRGLEALPPRWRKTKDGKGKVDSALPVRKFYIRAYEQAEKDTIERAVAWLKENTSKHIMGIGIGIDEPMDYFIPDFVWEEFRKAMEEQK